MEEITPLAGFTPFPFTFAGRTHEVYRSGDGPAVIVLHELPGLHPGVTAFGRRLAGAGFTAYLPSLFGRPGAPFAPSELLRTMPRVCVSREFAMFADRTSRVAGWLRGLAARASAESGGTGAGVVGMCFTGGFALATAVEPSVLAAVLSQPALPAPIGRRGRAALGLDPADRRRIQERAGDGLCVLGLRFSGDRSSPAERFETLRGMLGDAFEGIEIDSSPGNAHGIGAGAHSVLTLDLVDEPGHPTREALDRVVAFLGERLRPA